jgi:hypothetical protein
MPQQGSADQFAHALEVECAHVGVEALRIFARKRE